MSDYQTSHQHTTVVVVQHQPQSQAMLALASFFAPGLGQLIQGRPITFFVWIAMSVVNLFLMFVAIGFFLSPVLVFLCVLDAACWQPGKRNLVGTISACVAGMVLLGGIIWAITAAVGVC